MKTINNEAVKLVADVALLFNNKILLVTYEDTNKYDHQKGWFLPDDLVRFNEHPNDAVKRICSEQLGFDVIGPKLDHIESFTGGDKSWHLIFHYAAFLDKAPDLSLDDNISKAEWFDTDNLPDDNDIAHHGWARFTIEKIKLKQNNTN